MNIQPRIESINGRLLVEYPAAINSGNLEPFVNLLHKIEDDISRYTEYVTDHD